jgi:hypothetical protein
MRAVSSLEQSPPEPQHREWNRGPRAGPRRVGTARHTQGHVAFRRLAAVVPLSWISMASISPTENASSVHPGSGRPSMYTQGAFNGCPKFARRNDHDRRTKVNRSPRGLAPSSARGTRVERLPLMRTRVSISFIIDARRSRLFFRSAAGSRMGERLYPLSAGMVTPNTRAAKSGCVNRTRYVTGLTVLATTSGKEFVPVLEPARTIDANRSTTAWGACTHGTKRRASDWSKRQPFTEVASILELLPSGAALRSGVE